MILRRWLSFVVALLVVGPLAVVIPLVVTSRAPSARQTILTIEKFVETHYPTYKLPRPLAKALESSVLHDRDHLNFVKADWLYTHRSGTETVGVVAPVGSPVELYVQGDMKCLIGLMGKSPYAGHRESDYHVVNARTRGVCRPPGAGGVLYVKGPGL